MYIEKIRGLMDAIANEKSLSNEDVSNSMESIDYALEKFVKYFNEITGHSSPDSVRRGMP